MYLSVLTDLKPQLSLAAPPLIQARQADCIALMHATKGALALCDAASCRACIEMISPQLHTCRAPVLHAVGFVPRHSCSMAHAALAKPHRLPLVMDGANGLGAILLPN